MLTTIRRNELEKSVREQFEGKTSFSESFACSRDWLKLGDKYYLAILFAEFNGEDSLSELPEGKVKPLLLEREVLQKSLEESEAFRKDGALDHVAFITPVNVGGAEEEDPHDLVLNHYGPWDFLKLFFVSLFK